MELFQYNMGILPHRNPLHVVIGNFEIDKNLNTHVVDMILWSHLGLCKREDFLKREVFQETTFKENDRCPNFCEPGGGAEQGAG